MAPPFLTGAALLVVLRIVPVISSGCDMIAPLFAASIRALMVTFRWS